MTNQEAMSLISTLGTYYDDERFKDRGFIKIYIDAFVVMEWSIAQRAVDEVMAASTFSKCPQLGVFWDNYRRVKHLEKVDEPKSEVIRCNLCMDKGYMLVKEKIETETYEFVLYCPDCEEGKKNKYDGRTLERATKTPYFTEPITKYYSRDAIISQNLFTEKRSGQKAPMPDCIKEECRRLGMPIRALQKILSE